MQIFFIAGDGRQLVGAKTYKRFPRKFKKRQKKLGTFKRKEIKGFDVGKLFNIVTTTNKIL